MRKAFSLVFVLAGIVALTGQTPARATLDLYLIDVEGGNATLFVAPSGESLLVDTGNPGAAAARDAERILAAVRDARLTQIDHLITTHYHGDHYGAMAEVAAGIPVRNFIDHGPNTQPAAATDAFLQKTYTPLYEKAKHTVVKPGDRIAMSRVDVRVASSGGQVLSSPLTSAFAGAPADRSAGRPNGFCGSAKPMPDPSENAQSVGIKATFGRFRVVHLGDLTNDKEFDLMCPANRLGEADLFIVSHHGQATSNSVPLVHGLAPRVALMNNGPRKGGQAETMKILYSSPGLEDLWQLHFSFISGQEYSAPGVFIANGLDEASDTVPVGSSTPSRGAAPPQPPHNGAAYWIKVAAREDGTFTVTNARNGFSKTYPAEK